MSVFYNSVEDIAGFQFNVDGGTVLSASGGDSGANGFLVSSSETTVIGFSLTGSVVSAGSGILVDVEFEGGTKTLSKDRVLQGQLRARKEAPVCINLRIHKKYRDFDNKSEFSGFRVFGILGRNFDSGVRFSESATSIS